MQIALGTTARARSGGEAGRLAAVLNRAARSRDPSRKLMIFINSGFECFDPGGALADLFPSEGLFIRKNLYYEIERGYLCFVARRQI